MDDADGGWTPNALRRDIAELEHLLQRAERYENDIDVQWTRRLCCEVLERKREMLVRLETHG